MKLLAQINSVSGGKDGTSIALRVDNFPYSQQALELETNTLYRVEITKAKSKRSIEQNKLMWALIREIANYTGDTDTMGLYCKFLELANVSYDYIYLDPTVEDGARRYFRALAFVRYINIDGREMGEYKAYLGSSTFSSKEMGELLDVILNTAYELGLANYDYYSDLLRNAGGQKNGY